MVMAEEENYNLPISVIVNKPRTAVLWKKLRTFEVPDIVALDILRNTYGRRRTARRAESPCVDEE